MRKQDKMKSVYVVKSAPRDIDEKHRELDTKNVYLLKSDEEAISRCRDTVYSFIDDKSGLFLVLSRDKTFFLNFRNSFYKELEIEQERIRNVLSLRRTIEEIRVYREYQKSPFLFVESSFDGRSTLPFVEEAKAEFKDMFVIVLMSEVDEKMLAQFVEAGVDNFITKPVSVNVLVEKIANTLVPPDAIGQKVREGKERLRKVEFALAYGVARDILEMKPGSPAGLMIMGDALKGLCKRNDALKLYHKALENAPMYLEPRKKIVEFHKEDGNLSEALAQLLEIDELAPLNLNRKKEIAELYFMEGNYKGAARFYAEAVKVMHAQKDVECVRMACDYADKIFNAEQERATALFVMCSKLADTYKVELSGTVYNRLGMLLRRAKKWMEAVVAYEKANALSPDDVSILFNMGMAYVEGEDFGSAAQKFERAMRIDRDCYKDNLPMAYIMGQVFIRAQRMGNAATVLHYVHSQDPNFKKVKSLLKSLK